MPVSAVAGTRRARRGPTISRSAPRSATCRWSPLRSTSSRSCTRHCRWRAPPTLLRSPYVESAPGDWLARARLEATWLREGRREVSLAAIVAATGPRRPRVRAAAAGRDARRGGRRRRRAPGSERWRDGLAAAGWPGARALSSVEWQARGAWDELLAEFATLGIVTPRMTRGEAVAALGALARSRCSSRNPRLRRVQILGVLEAAGLPLDALWVAGLAAERWPPAPRPNPLLPLAVAARAQRAAIDGRARARVREGADRAVGARRAGGRLLLRGDRRRSSAHDVVAGRGGDAAVAGRAAADDGARAVRRRAVAGVRRRRPRAAVRRRRSGRGWRRHDRGAGDCPFQAMARYRLRAERWPEPVDGLSAVERGNLVHAALAAFWRDVADHATLIAMPPRCLLHGASTPRSRPPPTAIPAVRWSRLPAVVAAGEAARIAKTVRAWLDDFDRCARRTSPWSPTEAARPLALGGLQWTLRVDRIDTLADGGTAIIDYKTGVVAPPAQWFDERAREPQLGLYWLAQHGVRAGACRARRRLRSACGQARRSAVGSRPTPPPGRDCPNRRRVRRAGLADWRASKAGGAKRSRRSRPRFAAGTPRLRRATRRDTCKRCGRQPLCRIGAFVADDDAETGDG